jgi:hypothetical protein
MMIALTACSPQPGEQAIADYVQTIGNTKTDLSFDLKAMKHLSDITGKDSINSMLLEISKDYQTPRTLKDVLTRCNNVVTKFPKLIADYEAKLDSLDAVKPRAGLYNSLDEYSTSRYKLMYKKQVLELKEDIRKDSSILTLLNRYMKDSTTAIAKVYEVVYTIKNPILNNASQEVKRKFYLVPELTRVLSAE